MSFEINGPSNKPMIQEAQHMQNNGGGGNLGYFKRRNQEESQNEGSDLFDNHEEKDSFEHEFEIEEDNFITTIKNWFNRLVLDFKHRYNNKKNPFS